MEIAPRVHHIPGVIANPFLVVDDDGLTLIDAGLPRSAAKILQYVAGLGWQPGDLKRIVLTHSDIDHVGGLSALRRATGARTYASAIEAQAIAAGRASRALKRGGPLGVVMRLASRFFRSAPVQIDEIVAGGQALPALGGLRVVETPGHTPGHISLFAPLVGVLFAGDSMVSANGRLRASRGMNTWDEARAIESVRAQTALGAQIVCVGHGPVVRDAAARFPAV